MQDHNFFVHFNLENKAEWPVRYQMKFSDANNNQLQDLTGKAFSSQLQEIKMYLGASAVV